MVVGSTTGLIPLTVTVSVIVPIFMLTFTRALNPALSSNPARISG